MDNSHSTHTNESSRNENNNHNIRPSGIGGVKHSLNSNASQCSAINSNNHHQDNISSYYPNQHDMIIEDHPSNNNNSRNKILSLFKSILHIILGILGLVGFIIASGALRVTQKKLISRGQMDTQCLYEKGNGMSFSAINPYSVLGFSLAFYLLILIYEISVILSFSYCKTSHLYSVGGQFFVHLLLCIAKLINGIFIFTDELIEICSCISNNYYCNMFRINGILCFICSALYILYILMDLIFFNGIQKFVIFLKPTSNSSNSENHPQNKIQNTNINHSSSKNLSGWKSPKSPKTEYHNV